MKEDPPLHKESYFIQLELVYRLHLKNLIHHPDFYPLVVNVFPHMHCSKPLIHLWEGSFHRGAWLK